MAGTAVAVAEMANIRDRNWIFGLARSAGATRGNIAALVAVDGVLVLAVASLVSAVVLVPLAPAVERFALETLGSPIRLVAPGLVPQLALAAAVMILLGAAVPAARAARLDPVDVLERR
jgi:ABC-type antimicrobial peptide transport system permease subunit